MGLKGKKYTFMSSDAGLVYVRANILLETLRMTIERELRIGEYECRTVKAWG